MVCVPVRRDNPCALALARGLSTVEAHKPCTVDNPQAKAKARGSSLRTGAQTMLYPTCTMISSVDLAHYGIACTKDWVSVDCGTNAFTV